MQNPFYNPEKDKFQQLEVRIAILSQLLDYDVDDEADLLEQIENTSFYAVLKPLVEFFYDTKGAAYTTIGEMANTKELTAIELSIAEDIKSRAKSKAVDIYGSEAAAVFERVVVDTLFSYTSGVVLSKETKAVSYTKTSKLKPTYSIVVKTYINNQVWEVGTANGEVNPLTPTLLNGAPIEVDKYGFITTMKQAIEVMSCLKAKGCIGFSSCDALMDIDGLVYKAEQVSKLLGGDAKDHIQLAQTLNSGAITKKDAEEWLAQDYNRSAEVNKSVSAIFSNRLIE